MALNCIYKTEQGETSMTYEALKLFYRDHIDVKESTVKNVEKTLDDQAEQVSEHWYHWLFSDEFKEWFGNGRVNQQGEPELFITKEGGRTFAYFKNGLGVNKYIDGAKFNDMSLTRANELTNQILFQVFKIHNIDFNTVSDIKKISINWEEITDSIEAHVIDIMKDQPTKAQEARLGEVRRTLAKYKDDFISELYRKFEQFSIEFQMLENNVDELEESEQVGEVVRKDRGKVNSKDSASANIKMLLSFSVPEVIEKDGKRMTATGTLFGLPKFKRFGSVWNVLEPALSNMPTLMNEDGSDFVDRKHQLLSTVMKLSQQVPGLRVLVSKLDQADNFVMAQFHQAFDKNKTTYNRNVIEGEGSYTQKIITNDRAIPVNLMYMEWSDNLRETKYVKDGKIDLSEWRKEYLKASEDLDTLVTHLAKIGVNVSVNAFKGMTEKEFADIFTAFSYLDGKSIYDKGRSKNVFQEVDNKLNKLASNESANRGILGESTVLGPKGMYWTYANRSYIETIIDEIKNGDLTNIKNRLNDVYTKHSLLIGQNLELSQIQELFENINTQVFLSLQKGTGDPGVDSKGITDIDDLLTNINRTLANIMLDGTSSSNMLAPADKSTNILISGLPFIKTGNDVKLKDKNGRSPVDIIRGYIFDEMAAANQDIDDVLFKKGVSQDEKGLFTLEGLSSLDYLKDEDGKYKESLSLEDVEKLNKFIETRIDRIVLDGVAVLSRMSRQDGRGNTVNGFDTLLDSRLINYYKSNFGNAYKEALMKDYIINGMIANIEMTKLFTGYPGFYKNRVDFFKRVPSTQTDGRYLYLTKGDPKEFKVAVVNSIEDSSKVIWGSTKDEFGVVQYSELAQELFEVEQKLGRPTTLQQIASILDDYKENNIGDAQGWITYDRAKFLAQKSGMWRKELDAIDEKIVTGEILSPSDVKKMGPILQPWKGVHFEITPSGAPVYLKYSQAVLLPSLIKGSKLEAIDKLMKAQGVSELVTIDGVKVGPKVPQNIETVYSEGFTNIVTLQNRYWKLQQQLPSKKIKMGTLASQIQKNILANVVKDVINSNGEPLAMYDYRGQKLTGLEIIEGIVSTTISLLDRQKQEIYDELGIKNDFEIGDIKHHPKLKSVILKELAGRGETENILRAVETLESFDLVPSVRQKVQSVMASYFKKRFNDIQMNVGSMIQISNYGTIDLTDENKKGIYWIKKVNDLHGPVVKDGVFHSGQVLLPSWVLDEHIPNWREDYKDPNDLFGKDGIVDDRLLKAVGFRIPNQGMSSNDSLEVVGILPPGAGDSIYIYNGLTTKTGSDFDIDKMYMLFPTMSKRYKKSNVNKLFDDNKITRQGAIDILQGEDVETGQYPLQTLTKLVQDRAESGELSKSVTLQNMVDKFEGSLPTLEYSRKGTDGLRNKLLEYYLSVLESPATYVDMVTSIDKETNNLKNAINKVNKDSSSRFELFNPMAQVRVKNDLIKGKNGVGSTANNLVNHIYTQIYDIAVFDGQGNPYKLNTEYDTTGNTKVTGIISAFLNAFVDIAKDPYVLRGNFVDYTMGPAFLLLRSGVPYNTVVKFIGLPIIKQMASDNSYNRSKILRFYGTETPETVAEDMERASLLIDADLNALLEGKRPSGFVGEPSAAFATFFQSLKGTASTMTELIQSTTYEVNGGGRSIARQLGAANRVYNILRNPNVANADALFSSDTVLGTRLKNGILNLFKAQESLFYEAAVPALLNTISLNILGTRVTSEQDIDNFDKVANSVYQSIFAKVFRISDVDSYFTPDVKTTLTAMKKKYPTNVLLKSLSYDTIGGKTFYKMDNQRNKEAIEKDALTRDWETLLKDEPVFARFLIEKSFLESGFSPKMNAYHEFIPYTYFLELQQSFEEQVENLKDLQTTSALSEYVAASNIDLIREFKDRTPKHVKQGLRKLSVSKFANVKLSTSVSSNYTKVGNKLYKKVGSFDYSDELGDYTVNVHKESKTSFAFNQVGFSIVKTNINHTVPGPDIPSRITNDGFRFVENGFNIGRNVIDYLSEHLDESNMEQLELNFEQEVEQALPEVTLKGTVEEVNEDVQKLTDWYNSLSDKQKKSLSDNGGYTSLENILEQYENVPFEYNAEDMIRDIKCFL